jgi:U3 small nucleolar RNA-associated protein 14
LKKQTNQVLRSHNLLQTPLESKESKKLTRKLIYEQTSTKLGRWDDYVKNIRHGSQIDLRNVNQKVCIVPTEARKRKLGTEVERELDALLNGNEYIPTGDDELSIAEKRILSSVSIQEAKLRQMELRKHRILQCRFIKNMFNNHTFLSGIPSESEKTAQDQVKNIPSALTKARAERKGAYSSRRGARARGRCGD